jgi:transcriptional regulator with XRE-family HTH domain
MRERRLAEGLTQREVVERLARRGVRTTNRAISTMENGRGLDLGLLPEFADALDCTVTYLLGLSSDPHSWRPDRLLRLPAGADVLPRPPRTGARTGLTAHN